MFPIIILSKIIKFDQNALSTYVTLILYNICLSRSHEQMSVKIIDHIVNEHCIDIDQEMIKRVKVTTCTSVFNVFIWPFKWSNSNNSRRLVFFLLVSKLFFWKKLEKISKSVIFYARTEQYCKEKLEINCLAGGSSERIGSLSSVICQISRIICFIIKWIEEDVRWALDIFLFFV